MPPRLGLRLAYACLACAVVASPARADRCADSDASVGLVFEGEWPSGRQGAVVAELRAALLVQDLVLCLESDVTEPPVASLHLVSVAEDAVRVEVRDRVTAKRVERDLSLEGFPDGSRALAVAVAADELLRATWAELVLVDAPPPAVEPPPAVTALVSRERREIVQVEPGGGSRHPRYLGLEGGLRWHSAGALFLGGGLRIEVGVHERVSIALAASAANMHTEVVEAGSVDGLSIRGGLDLLVAIAGEPSALQLMGVVGARVGWARFEAEPARQEGIVATTSHAGTASVRLGLEGRAHFGAFQLRLGAWLGGALAGMEAMVDGEAVTGTSGLEIGVTLGAGVRL